MDAPPCVSWRKDGCTPMCFMDEEWTHPHVFHGGRMDAPPCVSWRKDGHTPHVFHGGRMDTPLCASDRMSGAVFYVVSHLMHMNK